MSEKLFFRLYWRPYLLLGVSFLLVIISSLAPNLLPHAWLDARIPGYYLYMFKGVAWLVKLSMAVFIISAVRAVTAGYFPRLDKLCGERGSGVVTGYKSTWSRGKQLMPIIEFEADGASYRLPLNDAKGYRKKDGDSIDRGYNIGNRRRLRYCGADPRLFYIPGEEIYSRKAAILRYVLFSVLFFVELYIGFFHFIVKF